MIERPSPNFDQRTPGGPVDMLVLHYTGMRDGGSALDRLCDPAAKVSAHYLIEEDGRVFRLVDEGLRAWHAGVSCWRGNRDVNARSVGIELVNPGHEFGYRPFPAPQMEALAELALGIVSRHPIPPRNVVGHSDVAPTRKQDPGELFNWAWLAGRGVGLWPDFAGMDAGTSDILADLARFGYEVADDGGSPAIAAFQRHFRPARVDGEPDAETAARLDRVLAAAEASL